MPIVSAGITREGTTMVQNINETPAIENLDVTLTMKDDEDAAPVRVIFNRDLGDTWSVWVGSTYMAVRNPSQGAVISRLVEQIAAQHRTIIFDVDGTERDHE
jgi:hypothetical protein